MGRGRAGCKLRMGSYRFGRGQRIIAWCNSRQGHLLRVKEGRRVVDMMILEKV